VPTPNGGHGYPLSCEEEMAYDLIPEMRIAHEVSWFLRQPRELVADYEFSWAGRARPSFLSRLRSVLG
jgi:hypothetical protein